MLCQEETEPDPWARERGQEEEWANVSAHQSMDNSLYMESDANAAPDAGGCKAVALGMVLRVLIPRSRKKKRLNSNA